MIHNDQDGVEAGGWRRFLDEIHGDGVPGLFQDQELFQESVGLVTLWLGSHTGGARLAVVLNEGAEEWPSVVIMDELKGLVLAKVSRDQMVVFVEKDAQLEIVGVGDVDAVLVSKKSFRVGSPVGVWWICDVVGDCIGRLGRFDIGVKLLDVHEFLAV